MSVTNLSLMVKVLYLTEILGEQERPTYLCLLLSFGAYFHGEYDPQETVPSSVMHSQD